MSRDLILAADVGFQATGMIVFKVEPDGSGHIIDYECSRPKKDTKRKHLLVSDSDADRCSRMVRDILRLVRTHKITQMVAELPSGCSQGARANRTMGIATGMMVAMVESLGLAVEWYTPTETRNAAVGKPQAIPRLPKTATPEEKKAAKKARAKQKEGIKKRVIEAMQAKHPALKNIKVYADLEHIADAAATFEASKAGNLVRLAKSANAI